MSCLTQPIDEPNDDIILNSLLSIANKDKVLSFDTNNDGIVNCSELPNSVQDSIFCIIENGRITRLNLVNIGLNGEIPISIGDLDQLTALGLSYNELTGEIPESIGNLSNLTELSLKNNHLSGNIPESIGKLKGLWNLNLSNNMLTGSVPESIKNLQILYILLINNNSLDNQIPDNFCDIYTTIDTLNISENQFCPPFPDCIAYPNIIGAQDCQSLACEESDIKIDSWCYANSDLNFLDSLLANSDAFSMNNIMDANSNGYIEKLELGRQIWHANRLEILDCHWGTEGCNLSGSIPENINNLSSLTTLDLQKNNLTGTIPPSLFNMETLEKLNLSDNNLFGLISNNICDLNINLNSAEHFDISENYFCPCFPDCISSLSIRDSCAVCDVNYLPICSELNESQAGGNTIIYDMSTKPICFNENELDIIQPLIDSSINTLDIFSFDIDSSNTIDPLELGTQIWENGNLLSLIASNLELSGTIPNNIGNLSNLETLFLNENSLSGIMPESICDLNINFENIENFNISSNNICPPYPLCIENFMGTQNCIE